MFPTLSDFCSLPARRNCVYCCTDSEDITAASLPYYTFKVRREIPRDATWHGFNGGFSKGFVAGARPELCPLFARRVVREVRPSLILLL